MAGGFPARPTFADFGAARRNIAPVLDPETDLDIADWVLVKHQVAGMGLLSARVLLKLTVANPAVLLGRAEAWNPDGETSGEFADPAVNFVSTGRITVAYPTNIPDQEGVEQTIAFSWAHAFQHLDPPTTLKHFRAAPIAATPNILTVTAWNAAGALENGNTCWLLAG